MKSTKKPKTRKKVGGSFGGGDALPNGNRASLKESAGNRQREQPWKLMNLREKRLESSLPKDLEDHIAGKGCNSIRVHKFVPMLQQCENSGCESRSGQGMGETRNIASLAIRQDEQQKGGCSGSNLPH